MFEEFGFETLTAPQAAVIFALAIGAIFGALAEVTKFCLRRSLIGTDKLAARAIWLIALGTTIATTQAALSTEIISFDDHRWSSSSLPFVAVILGGLLFGAGMVLTRGCVTRLAVLSASGNLRGVYVLLVFAVVVHATQKGVLSPLRVWATSFTIPIAESGSLLPTGTFLSIAVGVLLVVAAFTLAVRQSLSIAHIVAAIAIGGLVTLGWIGTGFVLYDDFDPIALESLSLASPASDTLFWTIASTSVSANFGVGLLGGIVFGAGMSALLFRRFQWQSFSSPAQTGRFTLGAVFMGFGATLTGGCTLGAGLSGVSTLSITAVVALISISSGAIMTHRLMRADGPSSYGSGAPSSTQQQQPAE